MNAQYYNTFVNCKDDELRHDLVKGYMVETTTETSCWETLYAVTWRGDIFSTGLKRPSPEFNKKGLKWIKVDSLPEGSEFIGNYPSKGIVL